MNESRSDRVIHVLLLKQDSHYKFLFWLQFCYFEMFSIVKTINVHFLHSGTFLDENKNIIQNHLKSMCLVYNTLIVQGANFSKENSPNETYTTELPCNPLHHNNRSWILSMCRPELSSTCSSMVHWTYDLLCCKVISLFCVWPLCPLVAGHF